MDFSNLFGKFRELFRGKKTIKDVTLEDLERERNRLLADQDKLDQERDTLAHREQQLLEEGRAVKNDFMRKRIAAKIKDGRDRRKTLDRRHSVIAKSLRIATGLHTIKENEAFYKTAGLGGALADLPLAQIVAYIENSPAGIERSVEGMRDVLESLNASDAALGDVFADAEADRELDDIMAELNDASGEALTSEAEERTPQDAAPGTLFDQKPQIKEK